MAKRWQIEQNFVLRGDGKSSFWLAQLSNHQYSSNSVPRGAHSSYKCIQLVSGFAARKSSSGAFDFVGISSLCLSNLLLDIYNIKYK